ncbi:hypothetical protein KIPB_010929, partial [Kipferlia bialata]
ETLTAERDTLATERDTLASERDALVGATETLAAERDTLASERDALAADKTSLETVVSVWEAKVKELERVQQTQATHAQALQEREREREQEREALALSASRREADLVRQREEALEEQRQALEESAAERERGLALAADARHAESLGRLSVLSEQLTRTKGLLDHAQSEAEAHAAEEAELLQLLFHSTALTLKLSLYSGQDEEADEAAGHVTVSDMWADVQRRGMHRREWSGCIVEYLSGQRPVGVVKTALTSPSHSRAPPSPEVGEESSEYGVDTPHSYTPIPSSPTK